MTLPPPSEVAPPRVSPLAGGSPLPGSMRSAWCGEPRPAHAESEVVLCGWVQGLRDLGGLVFVDLRDRSGIVQVVLDESSPEARETARGLRNEDVVRARGRIRVREGARNPNLATGEVEVSAASIEVLAASVVPPFVVDDDVHASEELRLEYRYLDLRRPRMQRVLALRHRALQATRRHLSEQGLLEIETPILFKSTPEGARDYLVPSRVSPGSFYALPQSPQVLKQVLMIAGFEGYFQVARCFRDEDLRANRQPEFTQVDLELAFCTEEDVFRIVEGCVAAVWKEAAGVELAVPFPRLTHADALARYGTDKPDLRFECPLSDVTDLLDASAFPVVAGARSRGEVVRALAIPGGAALSRKEVDGLTEAARAAGLKGLAAIKVVEGPERFSGSPTKTMRADEMEALARASGALAGSLMLLASGREAAVAAGLSAVRLAAADRLRLHREGFAFAWVHDFPMFEDSDGEVTPAHHPFCMPREEDLPRLESDPLSVRARTYDLVCNGTELASGSMRIHRQEIQSVIFRRLGLSDEAAHEKFGFLLDALAHGAPPHGGIALGFDRMVMLMAGEDNIRNVIAFPKTASARDLMAKAPSPVAADQLRDVGIAVLPRPE